MSFVCGGLVTLIAVGCDERAGNRATTPTAADALPTALVLTEAPSGAKEVTALKASAKEGDEVVLHGRVGGSKSPFVEGRASFQLIDVSMKACNEGSNMADCKTPWDFCCDDAKEVAAHSASVQVVGADGKPLRAGLQGVAGLKPLSDVTVKGTVAKAAASGPLVVNASGIYVRTGSSPN